MYLKYEKTQSNNTVIIDCIFPRSRTILSCDRTRLTI